MKIEELKSAFDEINKLKSKAKMNQSQFCSELTKSDDDEYLELHFDLLAQKKHYFQSHLKMYFEFRQDKQKTDSFLREKLKGVTDKKLREDIEEILSNIGYFPLDEYKKWFGKVKTDTEGEYLDFVWKLAKSPYTEYHYSLLTSTEINEKFRRDLWYRFEDHGEEAEQLLLSKLDNDEDTGFHANMISALGVIADKKHGKQKDKTLEYARKLTDSPDDTTRGKAIIVLGWIGKSADIPLLAGHLLNDSDAKCRAWSATSFMQMWFRQKNPGLVEKVLPHLNKAIHQEKDYFATGCMIEVVQELTQKKFGLSQKSVDEVNKEKIDSAKSNAERYFDKLYKVAE